MEWVYTVWLLMIPVVVVGAGSWVVKEWDDAEDYGDRVHLVVFGIGISGVILIIMPLSLSLISVGVSYLYERSVFS